MRLFLNLFGISLLLQTSRCQFNSETYPDPRLDPFRCKIRTIGPVCDPSELLTLNEKEALVRRIKQLMAYAATVINSSPSCQLLPGKSLEIIVGVVDKIGAVPNAPADIEKFANNLKIRYQRYQDVNLCDLMVLIVNSNSDRQVFTVAGKDTKLTKDVLKTAFEQNIDHFRNNNYAVGLQGMAEFITTSYRDAQLSQFGTPLSVFLPAFTTPKELGSENETGRENVIIPVVDKSDQLWTDILAQAVGRCGTNRNKMVKYVQGVVEEAMSLSLRLISDRRYLTIEEKMQSVKNNQENRSRVWSEAAVEFIDQLYQKYLETIKSKANLRCPNVLEDTRMSFAPH
ncbi:unnamed protein product [Litomosoides sigmodontis]|uniref:TPM domain-containing protein n=1 Tax=Litomosoides sigmodontis TaxID=42156 RepID=A0A3P6SH74_LITSI|nr:unnamed protein product [Litomosoides sigmodontis]